MLQQLGVSSKVWYDGLLILDHQLKREQLSFSSPKAALKGLFHLMNTPMKAFFEQR